MSQDEVLIEIFAQEDLISAKFFNRTDKEIVQNVFKENIMHKVRQQNYSAISEPITSEYAYLKRVGERMMPIPDKTDADLIVLRTIVKCVKGQNK